MTRPVPRPVTSTRVLADTEPEPMARMSHETALPTATVLRRPRGAERRGASAVTHPAIPVIRGPTSAELAPPLPLHDTRHIAITQTHHDVGPRLAAGHADTLPLGPPTREPALSPTGPTPQPEMDGASDTEKP